MVTPGPASIVVVDFSFSDLSGSKLRLAILEDAPFVAILSAIISALQKAMPVQSGMAGDVAQPPAIDQG